MLITYYRNFCFRNSSQFTRWFLILVYNLLITVANSFGLSASVTHILLHVSYFRRYIYLNQMFLSKSLNKSGESKQSCCTRLFIIFTTLYDSIPLKWIIASWLVQRLWIIFIVVFADSQYEQMFTQYFIESFFITNKTHVKGPLPRLIIRPHPSTPNISYRIVCRVAFSIFILSCFIHVFIYQNFISSFY